VVRALENGRELKSRTFAEPATVLAVGPDGKHIVIQGEGKRLQVWTWESDELKETAMDTTSVKRVAFDPSGSRMALAYGKGNPRVEVWSMNPVERLTVLPHEVEVNSVAFDASGQFVVTASSDRSARVWDVKLGRALAELKHDDEVWSAVFSPDGTYVASGGGRSDRTVRLWLWRPQDLIAETCARVGRDLSPDEWQEYLQSEPYRRSCEGGAK
jgi:WD40 repeat protein